MPGESRRRRGTHTAWRWRRGVARPSGGGHRCRPRLPSGTGWWSGGCGLGRAGGGTTSLQMKWVGSGDSWWAALRLWTHQSSTQNQGWGVRTTPTHPIKEGVGGTPQRWHTPNVRSSAHPGPPAETPMEKFLTPIWNKTVVYKRLFAGRPGPPKVSTVSICERGLQTPGCTKFVV